MLCPNCGGKLPNTLVVTSRTLLEVQFQMAPGASRMLQRVTDLSIREVGNPDEPKTGTHFTHCPACNHDVDITLIEVVPVCVLCGKEKPKMTQADNFCAYDGLVCLECSTARATTMCAGCGRLSRCPLGKRSIKAATA